MSKTTYKFGKYHIANIWLPMSQLGINIARLNLQVQAVSSTGAGLYKNFQIKQEANKTTTQMSRQRATLRVLIELGVV